MESPKTAPAGQTTTTGCAVATGVPAARYMDTVGTAPTTAVQGFVVGPPPKRKCIRVLSCNLTLATDSGDCATDNGGPSLDGSCGPTFAGNKTCTGTQFGSCCSNYGYCGSGSDYCEFLTIPFCPGFDMLC